MILEPIVLSLKVAVISTAITFFVGLILTYNIARKNIKGKNLWETLIMLPLILPPSVLGYLLLVLLGKRGIIGSFLEQNFDIQIIFTWGACVIASTVVALPLMYQSLKSGFLSIDTMYEDVAKDLGANNLQTFRKVTLPLALPGIISGLALSFARSMGEFGATLMVAGNIPNKTQTISTAIYFAVEGGDTQQANILVGIMTILSFVIVFSLNSWMKKRGRNGQ